MKSDSVIKDNMENQIDMFYYWNSIIKFIILYNIYIYNDSCQILLLETRCLIEIVYTNI